MATKKGGAPKSAPPPESENAPLPVVTVEKLEQSGHLLERLLQQNLSVFVDGGQRHKDTHREATSRPLNAAEAAQLAVAMTPDDGDAVAMAEQLQASKLRAYDEPGQREVLLAGGGATAPAFIIAAAEFTALVEMPVDEFEEACENETLEDAIADAVKTLRRIPAAEGRARAAAAMAHYADAAGVQPGKVWGLLIRTVTQALTQAVEHLDGASRPSQLIGSAEPTAGSGDEKSSTESLGGEQPS